MGDKPPTSIFDSLFSSSNRYKGKFPPLPSHQNTKTSNDIKSPPGPTTYFQNSISVPKLRMKTPSLGFHKSTPSTDLTHLGPASYKSHLCPRLCSKKKRINAHISIYLLRHIACKNSETKKKQTNEDKKKRTSEINFQEKKNFNVHLVDLHWNKFLPLHRPIRTNFRLDDNLHQELYLN